mmetsp:Transcript_15422/g.39041  ORF Transcript_15422/g.39041 Transcript_15422/m.39041 type:complete len:82 (+) Transcript_15422:21-266(+)
MSCGGYDLQSSSSSSSSSSSTPFHLIHRHGSKATHTQNKTKKKNWSKPHHDSLKSKRDYAVVVVKHLPEMSAISRSVCAFA